MNIKVGNQVSVSAQMFGVGLAVTVNHKSTGKTLVGLISVTEAQDMIDGLRMLIDRQNDKELEALDYSWDTDTLNWEADRQYVRTDGIVTGRVWE